MYGGAGLNDGHRLSSLQAAISLGGENAGGHFLRLTDKAGKSIMDK